MIILSYDIHDDKLRTRFSKHIKKYGHRLQYSVYEIDNSSKMLDNICVEIQNIFEKKIQLLLDCLQKNGQKNYKKLEKMLRF